MHDEVTLLDEDFPARLRAVFASRHAARQAADRLGSLSGREQVQVQVTPPDAPASAAGRGAGREEPRAAGGIYLEAVAVGFAAGLCLGLVYLMIGPSTVDHAARLLVAVAVFGSLAGLSLAGLLRWRSARGMSRPPPFPVDSHSSGWQVVVTARDLAQHYEAREILESLGGTDIRPL